MLSCDFDFVTKNRNCHAFHSFVFHNEQKNQDIGPSSTAADYYWTRTIAPSNKPSFTYVSQYL